MKRIIITLIILSGIFHFKLIEGTRFYPAQFGFFVFSMSVLGSYLLYKKNKWIGLLAGLFAIGFLKTYLLQQTDYMYLYKETIIGMSIFGLYYIIREMKIKQDILKWFMIPVILNIILILIQKFDGGIRFIPVGGITGFLGNPSVTSTFIVLSAPIFLRYMPKAFPLLFFTSIICESRVPFIALVISSLVYLYYTNIKVYRVSMLAVLVVITLFVVHWGVFGIKDTALNNQMFGFKERASQQVGTLDGIMHNPILGWGIGSFQPIMKQIPEEESYYCGVAFNERDYADYESGGLRSYMNHPHNEYIYGWWNVGIMFPILLFCLMRDISRKFTRDNVLPFSILVGGMVLGIGYFFCYPVWFMILTVLAIYDNQVPKKSIKLIRKKVHK